MKLFDGIKELIQNIGVWGPILSCGLITIESMLPVLPLAVFITFNFWYFGSVLGFIISWIFTLIGCIISFVICDKEVKGIFNRKILKNEKVKNLSKVFEKLTLSQLVVIIAIPFTPAFLINIVAGITNTAFKKYFIAILIGKIFLIWFWGYVGTNLIESVSNPLILIKIFIVVIIAYVISKIVNIKLKLQ